MPTPVNAKAALNPSVSVKALLPSREIKTPAAGVTVAPPRSNGTAAWTAPVTSFVPREASASPAPV